MKILILAAVAIAILLSGCASRSEAYKAVSPLNAVAAYFGSVAIHEGGHALSATASGADHVSITILPVRDNGALHLGFTTATFSHHLSSIDESFFNVSGTLAELATHMTCRALLRSGFVPEELQPTAQWLSLMSAIGVYGECVFGLARMTSTDLGKEAAWMSVACLGGIVLFDIVDIVTDNADRYLGVLFGDKFYKKRDGTTLRLITDGRFFGIGGDF